MTIVLPILFAAAALGLCARRITPWHWLALTAWIAAVAMFNLAGH